MDDKRADDKILTTKERINNIEEFLTQEKIKIKKITDIQESAVKLNKNMDRCISLLSESIKGPKTNNLFDDMRNSNNNFLKKITDNTEEEIKISKKLINKLYKEKEKIIKESKNKK